MDNEWLGVDKDLIVQGEDNVGKGWSFSKVAGLDLTDAWTQVLLLFLVVATYGSCILYYVHTKEWKTIKKKPKSKAYWSWEKNEVSYNLPVVSRHNDFLGWGEKDHYKDFDGTVYFYAMPSSGPYSNLLTFVKKRLIVRLKMKNVPSKHFFFRAGKHLDKDKIDEVEKKAPFTKLIDTINEIKLKELPHISFGVIRQHDTKRLALKVTQHLLNFDEEYTQACETLYKKLQPEIEQLNQIVG